MKNPVPTMNMTRPELLKTKEEILRPMMSFQRDETPDAHDKRVRHGGILYWNHLALKTDTPQGQADRDQLCRLPGLSEDCKEKPAYAI